VVWKPSPTQQLAAHHTMRLLEAAGLPPGVVNLVTGDGAAVSDVALMHRDLAGVHFTGSTATFQSMWRTVGERIADYATYPRLVGETGGKDFVLAHRVPTRAGSSSPWSEALSSTRGRSARPPPAPTSPARCGRRGCATSSSRRPRRSSTAMSPTSRCGAEPSSTGAPTAGWRGCSVRWPMTLRWRSSRAARVTTARASSSGPPSLWAATRRTRSSPASTSRPSSRSASTTTMPRVAWRRR